MNLNTNFAGKTVIVTGANSGVGKSVVIKLTKLGADVIGIARREDKLDEVLAIVHKHDDKIPGNGSFTPVVGDVTNPDDVQRLFDAALTKTGKVDVLINNAGVLDSMVPVGEMNDELWNKVLTVNLTAPMLTMKQAVNIMKEQETGGAIVNVCSLASITGGSAGAAYTASKHGLLGLTKNTAIMYRNNGIRCNAVVPGGIATPMAFESGNTMNPHGFETTKAGMGRMAGMAEPGQIADVILFLASDQSAVVNGAAVTADFGFAAF